MAGGRGMTSRLTPDAAREGASPDPPSVAADAIWRRLAARYGLAWEGGDPSVMRAEVIRMALRSLDDGVLP